MTLVALILRLLILNLDMHFRGAGQLYKFERSGIVREIGKKKEKKKEIRKSIPVKRKRFRKERVRIKSTKPKDHRFSNQKMIRRMYRNC